MSRRDLFPKASSNPSLIPSVSSPSHVSSKPSASTMVSTSSAILIGLMLAETAVMSPMMEPMRKKFLRMNKNLILNPPGGRIFRRPSQSISIRPAMARRNCPTNRPSPTATAMRPLPKALATAPPAKPRSALPTARATPPNAAMTMPDQRTIFCSPSSRDAYQAEKSAIRPMIVVPSSRRFPMRLPRSSIRSPMSSWKSSSPSRLPSASANSSTFGVMSSTSCWSLGPTFSTKSTSPGWSLSPALAKSRSMSLKAGPHDSAAVPTTPSREPISSVSAPRPGPISLMKSAMPVMNLPKPLPNLSLLKPSRM